MDRGFDDATGDELSREGRGSAALVNSANVAHSRWHTDKWSQAKVVMMSDAGIRDSLSRSGEKQQGMGFLMLHS